MRKPDGQTIFLTCSIVAAIGIVGYLFFQNSNGQQRSSSNRSRNRLRQIPFDGASSYRLLSDICKLGPRPSGSAGMQRQQELLQKHFTKLGGNVEMQRFRVRHPNDGSPVDMANMIVHWHPDRMERILLCAHYDTRPFPDQDPDPRGRKGKFIGANDGIEFPRGIAYAFSHCNWISSILARSPD